MVISDDDTQVDDGDVSGEACAITFSVDLIVFPGDDAAASLSDGSDVAEPSFPARSPLKVQPHPPHPISSMMQKTTLGSIAKLGIPSELDSQAGNSWIEAVEADALQVQKSHVFLLCTHLI
jgi:hypothetical protein